MANDRSARPQRKNIWLRLLLQSLLSLLSIGLALWLTLPRLSATEHLADGSSATVYPPWMTWVAGRNRLELELQVGALTPAHWNIVVDGRLQSLRINDNEVPFQTLAMAGNEGGWRGFTLDCSPWLRQGANRIGFIIDNGPSTDPLRFQPGGGVSFAPRLGWRMLLLCAGFIPWLWTLSGIFRLERQQVLMLALALEIIGCYWAKTPWNVRAHDVALAGGHLHYVAYIADHLALPRPDQGWTYYHPPLYYIVGAAVWTWAGWLGITAPQALQGLSLALWLVFLCASAGVLRLTLPRPMLLLATTALALWPSGIIHSIRIGNDAALYAAAAVATWLLLRWWRGGRRGHLMAAAAFVAIGLMCKSNAIVLAAAMGALLGLRLLLRHRRREWTDAAAAAAIVGSGMLLSLGNRLYLFWHGGLDHWLVPNTSGLPEVLRVPSHLDNFLPLHPAVFLSTPWLDSFDDASGRANFWNYLMRSALTGQFAFDGSVPRLVSLVWGGLLVPVVLMLLPRRRPGLPALWRDAPLLVLGLLWLAGLLALRIGVPYACSNDFRYILPLLPLFLVAAVRRGRLARTLLLGIALGSPVFFLSP